MTKKRLIIVVLVLLTLFLALNVNANCIMPSNGIVINQDTTLCEDTYELPYGIVVGVSEITLDCNNAIIKGFNFGDGIRVEKANGVTIKNCIVQDYENGIFLKKSSNVEIINNKLINNINGIALQNSNSNNIANNDDSSIESAIVNIDYSKELVVDEEVMDEKDNDQIDVKEDKQDIIADKGAGRDYGPSIYGVYTDDDHEKNKIEEVDEETFEKIQNDENAANLVVKIRKYDQLIADKAVEITKIRVVQYNKTRFHTKIKAKEDIKGLVLYEYFPKEVAKHVREINFYEKMILVEEDPIVKKEIGKMKKDEVITITYDLEKIVSGNTNPSSVVTIEKSTTIINLLASISYILAVYIILVLIKRHKADKLVKNFKKTTEKLYGVPFPIAYVVLMLIPKVNYSILMSENFAILVYIIIIKLEFWILYFLIKHKSAFYYLFRGWRKVKRK
jgi:parallel beta-helix repeat protein